MLNHFANYRGNTEWSSNPEYQSTRQQVKILLTWIHLILETILPQNHHSVFHCSDTDLIRPHEDRQLIQHQPVVITMTILRKSVLAFPNPGPILVPIHHLVVLHLHYSLCALKENLILFLKVRTWLSALVRIR